MTHLSPRDGIIQQNQVGQLGEVAQGIQIGEFGEIVGREDEAGQVRDRGC